MPPVDVAGRAPSRRALFMGFFGIGIVGFGGVLPWLRRMMVERRAWLDPVEFNELLALCQFLPGPNVVNMAVAIGARFHGITGSMTCVAGLLAAPIGIVIVLGELAARYGDIPMVAHGLGGLAAAATGLIAATAVKIARPLAGRWLEIGIAAVAFLALALLRLPLLPTMLILAPVSIALCARASRSGQAVVSPAAPRHR